MPNDNYQNLDFHRRLSVAPMLDWTTRHQRRLMRILTKQTLLYTEMVTAAALLHAKDSHRFLMHTAQEQPLALQLGGSNPQELVLAARMGEKAGFVEINLNCGCPSDRVQAGRFGACLMREADLVARCYTEISNAVAIPVTIKTRIGVDNDDSWEFFQNFIHTIAQAGCQHFIIHARKAWLKGLSPRENRHRPPLDYAFVYRLKRQFPDLHISLNGGLRSLESVQAVLAGRAVQAESGNFRETPISQDSCWEVLPLDGVMLGRAPYEEPWIMRQADQLIFDREETAKAWNSRCELVLAYIPYVEEQLALGVPLNAMSNHLLGLFNGVPGARAWRQHLSTHAARPGAGVQVLLQAMKNLNGA